METGLALAQLGFQAGFVGLGLRQSLPQILNLSR